MMHFLSTIACRAQLQPRKRKMWKHPSPTLSAVGPLTPNTPSLPSGGVLRWDLGTEGSPLPAGTGVHAVSRGRWREQGGFPSSSSLVPMHPALTPHGALARAPGTPVGSFQVGFARIPQVASQEVLLAQQQAARPAPIDPGQLPRELPACQRACGTRSPPRCSGPPSHRFHAEPHPHTGELQRLS